MWKDDKGKEYQNIEDFHTMYSREMIVGIIQFWVSFIEKILYKILGLLKRPLYIINKKFIWLNMVYFVKGGKK